MHKAIIHAKKNWKKIALIAGIIVMLIIAIVVSVKVYKGWKDSLVLDDADGGSGGGGSSSGSSADNQGSSDSGITAPTDYGTPTAGKMLKQGDKIIATEDTNMYTNSNLGSSSLGLVAKRGDYVGTVVIPGMSLKVENYSYKGAGASKLGYDFYIPYWKTYYVKR